MEYITKLLLLTLSIFFNAIIIGLMGFFITNSLRKRGNQNIFNWWLKNGRGFIFILSVVLSLIYYYSGII